MCFPTLDRNINTKIDYGKSDILIPTANPETSKVTNRISNSKNTDPQPTTDSIKDLNNKFSESPDKPISGSISDLFSKRLANARTSNDKTLPKDTITELGKTKNGATIYSHNDVTRGNTDVTTNYLCGHVFRTTSELKGAGNLKYSGFIHMAKNANKDQYFDVLGTGIKGASDKLKDKDNVTIMVTGFTPFGTVEDNPTSKFLLGDGKANKKSDLGFKPPVASDLDNMMLTQFKNFVRKPEPYYVTVDGKKIEAGRTYTVIDPATNKQKTINLATVRLPVDDDFRNGDDTGSTLKKSISAADPDAVLSFGAGTDGDSSYYVETQSYGVTKESDYDNETPVTGGKNYRYTTNDQFITNNDFSDIYRTQLRKK